MTRHMFNGMIRYAVSYSAGFYNVDGRNTKNGGKINCDNDDKSKDNDNDDDNLDTNNSNGNDNENNINSNDNGDNYKNDTIMITIIVFETVKLK